MRPVIRNTVAVGALCVLSLAACGKREKAAEDGAAAPTSAASAPAGDTLPTAAKLTPRWIAEGFANPEGVAARGDGTYFISNVNGDATARDGNGFISVVDAAGNVVQARWADGLDAPKGMAVLGDILYVADIDQLRRIDLGSGTPFPPIAIPGAKFLNDVTVWQDAIFVSDSEGAQILKVEGNTITPFAAGEALGGVNGLLGDGANLWVSTMGPGTLLRASTDGTLTVIAEGITNADGIGIVPGGFLVSSWPGQIFFVREGAAPAVVLDTRAAGTLQNDLSVFGDLVLVPNWEPGTVTAWQLTQ